MTGKPITPKKAGRPATPEGEALSRQVIFRVTKAEYAEAEKAAAGLSISVNEYARLQTLKRRRSTGRGAAAGPGLSPAVEAQLIRIGNNYNQTTRRLHMDGTPMPDELAEAGRQLQEIFRHILERFR